MGKLFERIINNRISKVVNISEAQAGGAKRKSNSRPPPNTQHNNTNP